MTKLPIALAVTLLAALAPACSDETEGSGCPGDIGGNYQVESVRISGDCTIPNESQPVTVGMARGEAGSWVMILPGVSGGCPGQLDTSTCKWTSVCELQGQDGTMLGNANMDLTFSTTGYSGTSVSGLRPPAVPMACSVTYRESAKKL